MRKDCSFIPLPLPNDLLDDFGNTGYRTGLEDQPYYLYVGDIVERKGVNELIQVFSSPQWGYAHHLLLLVGRNIDPNIVSNIPTNIRYLGEKDAPLVAALMKQSKGVLLPTKSDLFPRTVLEALVCGCKVLATKQALSFGYHSKVINNLFLAENSEPESLLTALFELENSPLENNNYDFQRHRISVVLPLYKQIYSSLLS